jgi:hypothetical protein
MVAVRRAVIFVAQVLVLILIVVATMAGALAGENWLVNAFPMLGRATATLPGIPGISIVGALASFFISTMLVALFFLCVEIAYNTRNPFNK